MKTCWRGVQNAAGCGVMHCRTASELIIHRKSRYTHYNTALCRWSSLIHLAFCHLIAQGSWWLLLTSTVSSSSITLSQSEIYSNDLMGLSAVKGFPVLLRATLFQLAGCDWREEQVHQLQHFASSCSTNFCITLRISRVYSSLKNRRLVVLNLIPHASQLSYTVKKKEKKNKS